MGPPEKAPNRRGVLRGVACLGVLVATRARSEAAFGRLDDAAHRVTGYASLQPVRGAAGPSLALPPPAVQAETERACHAAVAYAASTRSDALLIWRDGHPLLAKYFAPADARSRTWSASMFKTVVALVLGIAIRDGRVESVDQPVSDYLTRWKADERGGIRFRNLLEMTSGLDHPLAGTPSAAALETSDDRVAAAMALPLVRTSGAVCDYSTATTTLLMEAIGQAVQRPFADYLSQVLWAPLGAGDAWLAGDKTGHATPSLLAAAQDWMRVGLLIQQRGAWRGRQLAPADWIDRMTTPSEANPNYGWLVWLGSPPGARRSYGPKVALTVLHSAPFKAKDVVFLDGFGGQRVYIEPSQRLVIVRTGATWMEWDDAILPNAIIDGLAAS